MCKTSRHDEKTIGPQMASWWLGNRMAFPVCALLLTVTVLGCRHVEPREEDGQEARSGQETSGEEAVDPLDRDLLQRAGERGFGSVIASVAVQALEPLPEGPVAANLPDQGIWSDLDDEVFLALPTWLTVEQPTLVVKPGSGVATLYMAGVPVKSYPVSEKVTAEHSLYQLGLRKADRVELGSLEGLELTDGPPGEKVDTDGDRIPDPVDVMMGARKAALNGADYGEGYERIDYPGGDVSREGGVCTDVIVRAWRNAGVDLQQEIHRDMKRHPKRYGLGDRSPDRNIEHRRVRRMLPYFRAHYEELPAEWDPSLTGKDAWLPGDLVFMDTFPNKSGPDHVGIVSDQLAEDGYPLIINNWTYGYSTSAMALLDFVPVTHRFRPGLTR